MCLLIVDSCFIYQNCLFSINLEPFWVAYNKGTTILLQKYSLLFVSCKPTKTSLLQATKKQINNMNTWFATWFDSPYYHLLYQDRNEEEAHFFMDNLMNYLAPQQGATILDLACGKGRHAIYLANKGFEVTGVDLSPESIDYARQFEHNKLHFDTHDMKKELQIGPFDYIFNLFTSFGYFPTEEEHIETLKHIKNGLKSTDSTLVIDFFNATKVIQNLVLSEEKIVAGITFHINRRVENGFILKDIRFEDKGEKFEFQERVRAFQLEDFNRLFEQVGLKTTAVFGAYNFSEYDTQSSPRLILIAQPC